MTLLSASVGPSFHTASHEPTSDQSIWTGTTTPRAVFSMMPWSIEMFWASANAAGEGRTKRPSVVASASERRIASRLSGRNCRISSSKVLAFMRKMPEFRKRRFDIFGGFSALGFRRSERSKAPSGTVIGPRLDGTALRSVRLAGR
jgi:hypothetical protein